MKIRITTLALLGLMVGGARAELTLGTSNAPGNPLVLSGGGTSGPMLLDVFSSNPPNDVMAAWNVSLLIVGDAGSTGSVTFLNPASGTPPNPSNYVFRSNGLGIVVANGGSSLTANDFFDPTAGPGSAVPGSPGASLLQLDFQASSNASGLFGVFAVQGAGATEWTDGSFNSQFFGNVPDGTGLVRLGEIRVLQSAAVPEPVSSHLLILGAALSVGWRLTGGRARRCRQK
jgi:hypothetical protein